jgi:hypothetical protein
LTDPRHVNRLYEVTGPRALGDLEVAHRSGKTLSNLDCGFGVSQRARAGYFVRSVGVSLIHQRRDDHIGGVIGVHGRLRDRAGRQCELTGEYAVE